MKCVSYFTNKKTNETISYYELKERYQNNFATWQEFMDWTEKNFDEEQRYFDTPYERARNYVYATGNKWAIENWNSTHN